MLRRMIEREETDAVMRHTNTLKTMSVSSLKIDEKVACKVLMQAVKIKKAKSGSKKAFSKEMANNKALRLEEPYDRIVLARFVPNFNLKIDKMMKLMVLNFQN